MQLPRPLVYPEEVYLFVNNVLGITKKKEAENAVRLITGVELKLRAISGSDTLHDRRVRYHDYCDDESRDQLRDRIFNELKTMPRLENDDKIKLGRGGARPLSPKPGGLAFYVIGPPASGKSSIVGKIADKYGAYVLDSDYAKRKLPEYRDDHGATLVHAESDMIIFGGVTENLMDYCSNQMYNMVVTKIGASYSSVCNFSERAHKINYKAYLISVDLDRIKATQRAYNRFMSTHRYVPLSMVLDEYSNESTLNYYRIKQRCPLQFDGYAQINTDVPKGKDFILVESEGIPEFIDLFGRESDEGGKQIGEAQPSCSGIS